MGTGTHDHEADQRNETVLVYINGALVPRQQAQVSVFDSGFLMGDGIWEGLRLYNGRVPYLGAHLDRLSEGARSLDIDIGWTTKPSNGRYQTVDANTRMALQPIDGQQIEIHTVSRTQCEHRPPHRRCRS